jgi:hypothetical protein
LSYKTSYNVLRFGMDLTSEQAVPSELFDVSARQTRKRTRLVSVRLPEELVLRLSVVGNGEEMTMSETIRRVLERGLGQVKAPKVTRKKKKRD